MQSLTTATPDVSPVKQCTLIMCPVEVDIHAQKHCS